MPISLIMIVAAFLLALRPQSATPPVPSRASRNDPTEGHRFKVSYRQQFIAVQAAQTSTVDAKFAVLLTLVALLFQYVDGPIINPLAHWAIFAAYCFVAAVLLALLAMQRVEVWTELDPLLQDGLLTLDADTLERTHELLGKMMRDNEVRLGTKEKWMRVVLSIGLLATIMGLVVETRQPASTTATTTTSPSGHPAADPSPATPTHKPVAAPKRSVPRRGNASPMAKPSAAAGRRPGAR